MIPAPIRAGVPPRTVALTLVLAAAVMAAACGTGPPDHVRLGVVAPMSGPRAHIGREIATGARMAVEDVNDDGGLLGEPVELVVVDDASLVDLPGRLADLAEQARVSAVVGPEAPGVLLGERSPLSRRGVPALLPTAFAGSLGRAPTYVARTVPSARAQARSLGAWLVDVREIEQVAVLVADPIEGTSVRDDLHRGLASAGVEVAAVVEADAEGTAALGPAVAQLRRRAGPVGAVLVWGPPAPAARATRAVRDAGWDVQLAVSVAALVAEYRTLAGRASEGVVVAAPFRREWLGERMTRWMVRYHLEHGIGALPQLDTLVLDLPVVAAASYDAVGVIAAAVERAGTRRPRAVADALPRVSSDGLLTTYELTDREAWGAADLHVGRFHHLGLVFDVAPALDRELQRRLWEVQVGGRFLPDEIIERLAGEGIRELLAERRARAPDYEPPLPPPGPVARP